MRQGIIQKEKLAAKACGLIKFHSDAPCHRCGCEIRYTDQGQCVDCVNSDSVKLAKKIRRCMA